jgi:succinoglycan biosynthesis transport protein ExoP
MTGQGLRGIVPAIMNEPREMTLRDYARVVWRRKWIVIASVVASMAGALVLSAMQDPIYEAQAQVLVEPRSGDAVFDQNNQLAVSNLDRAIQTEIKVMEGQKVRERVQQDLGLAALPPKVDASPVGSTDVVTVTVRSGDPEVAQRLTGAYIDAYISTRREQAVAGLDAAGSELQTTVDELQAQIDATDPASPQRQSLISQQATFKERLDQLQIDAALTTGGASVVQSADLPTAPVEPTPARTAVLAGVIGLLFGLAAAFLVEYLDDSLRSTEDVEALTGLPVLAVVPVEPPPDNRPIALSEPNEFAVEVYRGLRTSVQFLGLDRPLRIIQVTSSLPGEGKTTTATNLAVVIAQGGNSVVLVDADLRRPRIHEVFDIPLRPGLTETLIAAEPVDMAISQHGMLNVVAAGTMAPNQGEMLSSGRFNSLIKDLASRFDYVIIDSAPVLPVADSLALSRVVDGVLVVAQANRTSQRNLTEGLSRLEQVGAPLIGVVLNRAVERSRQGYGYGYAYGYRSEPPKPSTPAVRPVPPPPAASPTPAHGSAPTPSGQSRPIGEPL